MRVTASLATRRVLQHLARLPWLAVLMATAILIFHSASLERTHWVGQCCVIWTSDHPFSNLLRMPGSVLTATPGLPCWGAVLQVLIVVGLAEIWCGRRRVLITGLLSHVIATLVGAATLRIQLQHGQQIAHVRDTGPSVFVLSVAWMAVCTKDQRWLRRLLAVVTALVVVSATELVAVEHLTGALCGWAVGAWLVWRRDRGVAAGSLRQRSVAWLHGLRLRHLGAALGVLALLGATWHDYEPLTFEAASTRSMSGPVVALGVRDLAFLPVHVAPPASTGWTRHARASGWWSTEDSCHRTHVIHARWVWRRRLWWCQPASSPIGSPVTIRYSVIGIHETARARGV